VIVLASLADVATYAPVAFFIGVAVGLALSSRYQITRRPPDDRSS
jgi:hypothetical protein